MTATLIELLSLRSLEQVDSNINSNNKVEVECKINYTKILNCLKSLKKIALNVAITKRWKVELWN